MRVWPLGGCNPRQGGSSEAKERDEGDELDLCLVDRYISVSNGRHTHMSGAFESARMRVGLCDMRRVHGTHAAARGAVARASRRPCLFTHHLLDLGRCEM